MFCSPFGLPARMEFGELKSSKLCLACLFHLPGLPKDCRVHPTPKCCRTGPAACEPGVVPQRVSHFVFGLCAAGSLCFRGGGSVIRQDYLHSRQDELSQIRPKALLICPK